jgi:hypothetical protein
MERVTRDANLLVVREKSSLSASLRISNLKWKKEFFVHAVSADNTQATKNLILATTAEIQHFHWTEIVPFRAERVATR